MKLTLDELLKRISGVPVKTEIDIVDHKTGRKADVKDLQVSYDIRETKITITVDIPV